jgi:selenocysteine-specific translation elongation factor
VTGTLIDGGLRVGQEIELLPVGLHARIRGLQNHNRQVEEALPGRRTAINLSGVSVDQLERGMTVALPGTLRPTASVDVQLRAVPYLERAVRHNTTVSIHAAAAESEARLLLLDADTLAPGESAWAQLRLAQPLVALPGDRVIVRDPNGTLGGGTIVVTDAVRHRRHHPPTIASLEALASGATLAERPPQTTAPAPALSRKQQRAADDYLALLRANRFSPPTNGDLPKEVARHLIDAGQIVRITADIVFTADAYEEMVSRIRERLGTGEPLTLGEVRDMFGTSRNYAQAVLEHLDTRFVTKRVGDARVLR